MDAYQASGKPIVRSMPDGPPPSLPGRSPARPTEHRSTISPPQIADGIWEWADYDAVRSRISQIKGRQLSQVTPSPLDVIDIRQRAV